MFKLKPILFLLFIIPALLEGIGIRINRELFLMYYLALPVFLYLYLVFNSPPLHLPLHLSLIALLYLLFSNISTFFFSLDKQTSFEHFLFSLSLFLIFIFFQNLKSIGERYILLSISILSIIFIGYSLLIPYLTDSQLLFFVPLMEKQAVFAKYGSHNHLGDFLGLLLIILLVKNIKKSPLLLLVSFFSVFFFFIFSFSRSAYLSFFFIAMLFLIQNYKHINRSYLFIALGSLSAILIITFVASSRDVNPSSFLFNLKQISEKHTLLSSRDILSSRGAFTKEALSSISENPLFGIGGGNFILASLKYNRKNDISDSAHNIFLQTAVEQGIPAAFCLVLIAILLVYQAIRKKSLFGYLFIYLLLNFQTDYTYQIYFFLILLTVLAGIIYSEENPQNVPVWSFGVMNFILLGSVFLMTTSFLFLKKGLPQEAIRFYPFNKEAYISAIQQSKGDDILIRKATNIAPYDIGIIITASQEYLKNKDKEKALELYEKAYEANHLVAFSIMKQIYFFKKEVRSKQEADMFLGEISRSFRNMFIQESFKKEFGEFCKQANEKICEETGWYKRERKKTIIPSTTPSAKQ